MKQYWRQRILLSSPYCYLNPEARYVGVINYNCNVYDEIEAPKQTTGIIMEELVTIDNWEAKLLQSEVNIIISRLLREILLINGMFFASASRIDNNQEEYVTIFQKIQASFNQSINIPLLSLTATGHFLHCNKRN